MNVRRFLRVRHELTDEVVPNRFATILKKYNQIELAYERNESNRDLGKSSCLIVINLIISDGE